MPLYDFKCNNCKASFEELCKLTDKVTCMVCGSENTERLIGSPSSVIFSNPKEGSKYWDNFEYRAGVNMEKAKAERRFQQANDPHGPNPYNDPDVKLEI